MTLRLYFPRQTSNPHTFRVQWQATRTRSGTSHAGIAYDSPRQPPILSEIPRPQPQSGEIEVRIRACGLNFADLLMARGTYQDMPPLPITLGMELAGDIVTVGAGGEGLGVGQRVGVNAGHGGLAEYGCFPATAAMAIPDVMPFTDAAAFAVAYGTSHLGLTRRAATCRSWRRTTSW